METIELFINFPIMDANRNTLRKSGVHLDDDAANRLTRFWGDDSWSELYSPDLFGNPFKVGKNSDVAKRFAKRLKDVAGFAHVPEPLALRNTKGGTVFFLFFASHNATGAKIAREIFAKARKEQDHG
ncbi:MAG: hypothetical protein GEEBNDBF_02047 [bacterium]|nr:hypothetical protein [bacterium]